MSSVMMTASTSPRMIPRCVSSLIFSPARKPLTSSRAINSPLLSVAVAIGSGRRMAADRLPLAALAHPHVGQQHAVLDHPAEVANPPARLDGADHHLVEHRRIADLDFDRFDLSLLDRVEPLVAVHGEGASGARADQYEVRVDQRAQLIHVLAAQGIAPLALQRFDELAGATHRNQALLAIHAWSLAAASVKRATR